MKFLLIGLLSVFGVLPSVPAFAACVDDVVVESVTLSITPTTECVSVEEVWAGECVARATIQLRNDCEEILTVFVPLEGVADYDPNHIILPGESRVFDTRREGPTTTWTQSATLGDESLQIEVVFESRLTTTYDGCLSQAAGAGVAPFFLFALAAGFRRRLL